MKRYDAVIFDLDGTILDTSEGIFRSVNHVISTMNLPGLNEDVIRTFIGPPMQRSFARVYGMTADEAMKAADIFRSRYKESDLLLARPYEGIFETIKALESAGIGTAVATYKRQDYAERILKHFGFADICSAICGSDFEQKLTKKDIIMNAMKLLGVNDCRRAVMVGDSDNDAVGAAECGADFIAVTYGFGFTCREDTEEFTKIGIAAEPEGILEFVL